MLAVVESVEATVVVSVASVAVYQGEVTKKVMDLLLRDRVDFIYPADYREHSGLDKTVKNIIRKMAVCEKLYIENFNQKNGKFQ